jgi:hypothetical protein
MHFVGAATNTHLSWELGNHNQPLAFTENAESDAKGLAVYSAGFISQAAGAEVILQADRIDKNDSYVRGMMSWDIIIQFPAFDYCLSTGQTKRTGTVIKGTCKGSNIIPTKPLPTYSP